MPIDPDFPKNHQTIGKHKLPDGEHYHFVWGPGRSDAETATKPEVQEEYRTMPMHSSNERKLVHKKAISLFDGTPKPEFFQVIST